HYEDESADFGALISAEAKESVEQSIDKAEKEGANIVVDGRNPQVENNDGFFLGATLIDNVTPDMDIYKEEVFGPARTVVSTDTPDEAIDLINNHQDGNGVTIFTDNGKDARNFKQNSEVGMVGVNVPVPIAVGYHHFVPWKQSRVGDGQTVGPDTAGFFTQPKTISERWPDE